MTEYEKLQLIKELEKQFNGTVITYESLIDVVLAILKAAKEKV